MLRVLNKTTVEICLTNVRDPGWKRSFAKLGKIEPMDRTEVMLAIVAAGCARASGKPEPLPIVSGKLAEPETRLNTQLSQKW